MKNFLTVLLTFTLYFNLFTTAHASANLGGWTLGGGVAKGASTVYEGTKKVVIDGVDYIKKGTASITPNGTQVAKTLAKGAAGYALSFAVQELLGSVDWVLDPANNQIKYWDEPGKPYYVGVIGSEVYGDGQTREEACQNYAVAYQSNFKTSSTNYYYGTVGIYGDVKPTSQWWCYLDKYVYETHYPNNVRADGNVDPDQLGQTEGEVKTYPLPLIADYLITKADEGNTTAQGATTAAAADIVAEAEKDDVKARPIVQQLEASAQTKPADEAAAEKANEATGEAKPNTANPEATDLSIEFPVFCGWAPLVCEAAQTVISFPTTLTDWWNTANQKADDWATSISEAWTSVKDWAKSENQDDTELDIPEQEQPEIDTDIAFGGSCPSDREAEVNMGVGIIKLPISYEPICTTVSTAKPVLIFVGFFIAALIIGGVKTE